MRLPFLICLIFVLITPFASAQFYYGYMNPSDFLDNQWFIFTALFAVFFGVIYASLGKVIGGSAPALVISAAIALIVSAGMQEKWYFLEQPVMLWAGVLIAALLTLAFVRFLFGKKAKKIEMALTALVVLIPWGLWPFFKESLSIYTLGSLPYELIGFLDNTWFLAFIGIIGAFAFILKNMKSKEKKRHYFEYVDED